MGLPSHRCTDATDSAMLLTQPSMMISALLKPNQSSLQRRAAHWPPPPAGRHIASEAMSPCWAAACLDLAGSSPHLAQPPEEGICLALSSAAARFGAGEQAAAPPCPALSPCWSGQRACSPAWRWERGVPLKPASSPSLAPAEPRRVLPDAWESEQDWALHSFFTWWQRAASCRSRPASPAAAEANAALLARHYEGSMADPPGTEFLRARLERARALPAAERSPAIADFVLGAQLEGELCGCCR